MTFKQGDIVECIAPISDLVGGKRYTVVDRQVGDMVGIPTKAHPNGGWLAERFRRLPEATEEEQRAANLSRLKASSAEYDLLASLS